MRIKKKFNQKNVIQVLRKHFDLNWENRAKEYFICDYSVWSDHTTSNSNSNFNFSYMWGD